jgi:imidazolonepropionase-like amidohydrolase
MSVNRRRSARLGAALVTAALAHVLPQVAVPAAGQQTGVVVFENVNVIPMDTERVLENRTVIVRNGRIESVAAASAQVPQDAIRVDGTGRYLIPGLAEMHGHIPNMTDANAQFVEDVLFLYVAAGATTVRGMQGNPTQAGLRSRIESGDLIGPRLILSSRPVSGNMNASQAEAIVREAKQQGLEVIKVHEGLSVEAYDAVAHAAAELDMQWGGHISDNVGLQRALDRRQTTIDHLDNYVLAMLRDPAGGITAANIDENRIPALARATREAGVAVVPTMALWEVILGVHNPDTMMDRPELRYMPRPMVEGWRNNVAQRVAQTDAAQAALEAQLRLRMLGALDDAGAVILMGTDAPQLFSVPGFSLHRELDVMAKAGMTPFEILRSGTTAVADHFGWDNAGRIEAGHRADLILLDANPLLDIANVSRTAGVVVNGRWLSAAEIQRELDAIAARAAS